MHQPLRSLFAIGGAALLCVGMAACTQTASAPPPGVVPGVTPNSFSLPAGSGCGGEIARFRAVLKNDVDTGNLGEGVYKRATADLERSASACAAGREGEAVASLSATKSRYGYR